MCDFCDYIFDSQLLYGRYRGDSQNKQMQEKEREIFTKWHTEDRDRKYDGNYLARNYDDGDITLVAVTGDSFCEGSARNINYCPYCGRNLKENE